MVNRGELTVLIIDDEPDILELLQEEFEYVGYKTLTAACGNDAIDILGKQHVDIVLSDYKMPNGNGMAVLEAVQRMAANERPAFFFVSGEADVSVEEAISAGARKFFSKPFDLDELIKQIEETL